METRLQELRKAAGWKSAKAFAEHIGISVRTYTNYEQGARNLMLDTAVMLCNELGCTLDELVGRDVPKKEEKAVDTVVNDEELLKMIADRLAKKTEYHNISFE